MNEPANNFPNEGTDETVKFRGLLAMYNKMARLLVGGFERSVNVMKAETITTFATIPAKFAPMSK